MDFNLLTSLKNKIDMLDDSGAIASLKSAAHHIDAAIKHLLRGQKDNDDSAFTDVIYRTNLAFDSCIKEAYRTLAGRNPALKSLTDIENYLAEHKIFRSRILKQFTDYQAAWRINFNLDNPASFSQTDAFMAITTVSTFAVLLIDQLKEYRAYLDSQAAGKLCRQSQALSVPLRTDLLSRTVNVVEQFYSAHSSLAEFVTTCSEEQLISALHGFISTVAPELSVILKGNLPINSKYHAALIIVRGGEKVLFEFKHNAVDESIHKLSFQTEQAMYANGIKYGVLFCFTSHSNGFKVEEKPIAAIRGKLVIFST